MSSTLEILQKRLAGWEALLKKPAGERYFTLGEIERSIAHLKHEIERRSPPQTGDSGG